MKKIKVLACILVMVICMTTLSGCANFHYDDNHAIIEVTNSAGEAFVRTSYNGLNQYWSGVRRALNGKLQMQLNAGEMVYIHFYCPACGHDETDIVKAPFAKMYTCDCPEDGGENYEAKEYFAVEAETKEEEEKAKTN